MAVEDNTLAPLAIRQSATEAPLGQRRLHALWSLVMSEPALRIGICMAIFLVLFVVLTPFLVRHDPFTTTPDILMPPSWEHLIGTDSVGRDLLARLVPATRSSVLIALAATCMTMLIGTAVGVCAGYWGSWIDWLQTRVVDILLSIPPLLLTITVIAALGPSVTSLIIVLTLAYVPQTVRLMRAAAAQVVQREYVSSARISGVGAFRTIIVHIIPNIRAVLIVQATVMVAQIMLIETVLSFLGFGIQPPTPSLGYMVAEGRQWMEFASWVVLAPGVAIAFAVATFTFIGHGLDQVLSVRS